MVYLIGCHSTQTSVPSVLIVELHPIANALLCLIDTVVGFKIDLLIFLTAPETLDKYIVHPATLAVHADLDILVLEHTGEALTGKLTALIAVEDLWRPSDRQCLLQRLNARRGIQTVG
jgi:hypothetical protein